MFKNKQKNQYKKILGNLTDSELEEFIKRYTYYLKSKMKNTSNELSKNLVLNGFFILSNILKTKNDKIAIEFKYKSSNNKIIKYSQEIETLYKQNLGYVRISNSLLLNHKVKISKSSIYRFIKENGITKDKSVRSELIGKS